MRLETFKKHGGMLNVTNVSIEINITTYILHKYSIFF